MCKNPSTAWGTFSTPLRKTCFQYSDRQSVLVASISSLIVSNRWSLISAVMLSLNKRLNQFSGQLRQMEGSLSQRLIKLLNRRYPATLKWKPKSFASSENGFLTIICPLNKPTMRFAKYHRIQFSTGSPCTKQINFCRSGCKLLKLTVCTTC